MMDATFDNNDKTRFDFRLPRHQKELFERAAVLGGYRNLTDFLLMVVQDKANEIIKENESYLASEWDREVFFDSIMNPPKPNEALLSAAKEYKDHLS